MTTDLRGLDLASLTRDTGLEIQVRSGTADLKYTNGRVFGPFTTVVINPTAKPGTPLLGTPISIDDVLSAVAAVQITTGVGIEFDLTDPELLRKLAPIIPAARKWARDNVHGGSPTAQVLIGLTPDGYVPGPSFAHGNQHPAGYVNRVHLKGADLDTTVSVVVCPTSGCRIVHVGL